MHIYTGKLLGVDMKIYVEFSAEEFENAVQEAYLLTRSKYYVPTYKKGLVPRAVLEKHYSEALFWEDAIYLLLTKENQNILSSVGLISWLENETVEELVKDMLEPKVYKHCRIEKIGKNAPKPFDTYGPFIWSYTLYNSKVCLGEYKGLKIDNFTSLEAEKRADALVAKAVENAQVEISPTLIMKVATALKTTMEKQFQDQGTTLEEYLTSCGIDELLEQISWIIDYAQNMSENRLVLEEIAKTEQIEITDEMLNEYLAALATEYQLESKEIIELLGGALNIKKDLAVEKAIELIIASAISE